MHDGAGAASGGISIVVPVFNEAENLDALHARILAVRGELNRPVEVIYVDDGSTDGSRAVLERLASAGERVILVRLARNFGQTAALAAGIEEATEDIVVTMDADLQNDPADIPSLVARLDGGADVASGWRRLRHDAVMTRKIPSTAANWIISRITGVRLHDHGCTLKAYRREIFERFRLVGEMHRFAAVHAAWAGARIVEVEVRHHPRTAGASKYGLGRTWKVVLDLITIKILLDYGTRPIHVFGAIGILSCVAGVLSGATTLVERALDPTAFVHKNPLILLAVFLFLVGVQSIMLGLLAEIGMRSLREMRGGRAHVVAEVRGRERAPGAGRGDAGA
jgi:glycosyltransferase involved in cell wall biosynthesis